MLFIPVYALADVGNVRKDCLLVAFSEALRWRDFIALAAGSAGRRFGMVGIKEREESR